MSTKNKAPKNTKNAPIDFSNVKSMHTDKDSRSEYTFEDLEGTPTLIIAPATQSNKPFYSKLLKSQQKNIRLQRLKISPEIMEKNRRDDKKLYAQFVIKDWEGITDANGDDVPFCVEACYQFLKALPNYMMDGLRQHAADDLNFLDDHSDDDLSDFTLDDAEETAKNS